MVQFVDRCQCPKVFFVIVACHVFNFLAGKKSQFVGIWHSLASEDILVNPVCNDFLLVDILTGEACLGLGDLALRTSRAAASFSSILHWSLSSSSCLLQTSSQLQSTRSTLSVNYSLLHMNILLPSDLTQTTPPCILTAQSPMSQSAMPPSPLKSVWMWHDGEQIKSSHALIVISL